MKDRAKGMAMLALCGAVSGCEANDPVTRAPARTVDYVREIQALLDKRCVRCHRSSAEVHGYLNLDADSSYHQLVTRMSRQRPELPLVEPHAPEVSYLMWKLENDPRIEGKRMPLLALPMPDEEVERVRTWILEGAFPQ